MQKISLRQRWSIYADLSRHRSLAERRDPMYARNQAGKVMVYVAMGFIALYLVFLAVMFAFIANDSQRYTAMEVMYGVSPFIFWIDCFIRFVVQQTPAQLVKPYVLLPLPRNVCIDAFVTRSLFGTGNLVWMFMFVPYAVMSILFAHGLWVMLTFLLGFWILELVSSQVYSIIRTLTGMRVYFWILPLLLVALTCLPALKGGHPSMKAFVGFYAAWGEGLCSWQVWAWAVLLALLATSVAVNRKLQVVCVWQELAGAAPAKGPKRVWKLHFLERYGDIGEYIRLEVKSIFRNRNMRKSVVNGLIVVVIISLVCSFSNVYDGEGFGCFWCLYCYVLMGGMVLTKIMSFEGNYIECLMVRRQNIYKLLQAKYIFYAVALIIPFLLMLPPVIMGKWPLLMLVSFLFFTAGCQYFFIFQIAVYNKQTLPLNEKHLSKTGTQGGYYAMAVSFAVFLLPILLVKLLQVFSTPVVSYVVMLAIGLAFMFTQRWWMANIYRRMMRRRYQNLEGFRATR